MTVDRGAGAWRTRRVGVVAVLLTVLTALTVLTGPASSAREAGPGPGRPSPAAGAPPVPVPSRVLPISVAGSRIVRGGRPWWFVGYNSFTWSGNCGHDDEKMTAAQVDAWFASIRHDGHGAARLFFYAGWDVGRLDAAVASARRHHVYLILSLDDALGNCGQTTKDARWFADRGQREGFRRHMVDMLQRYRGDPVFAWFEYLNEPGDPGGALRPFYDDMGRTARQVDPTRLFSSGTQAPYAVGGPANFRAVSASPGVDIVSLHEYDENEDESNHGPETKANAAGKPVIVGEFGIKAGRACRTTFADRAARFARKTRAYLDGGYAGALGWAWQPGGGPECAYENLDEDRASQQVLRTAAPSSSAP